MHDIAETRTALKTRLQELKNLEAAGEDERATVTLDQQAIGRLARMDLMQRQQMAKETLRRRRLECARIKAALRRMDEGEYGWCAECGSQILQGRLDADPMAHLCLDCAK